MGLGRLKNGVILEEGTVPALQERRLCLLITYPS